jgi:hypothetical protein
VSSLVSDVRELPRHTHRPHATADPPTLCGVEVIRKGRVEPFLHAHPSLSSSSVRWAGLAVEDHSVPACVIHRHEHLENFLHVILRGSVKYEVLTRGKVLDFHAQPGTTFILPQGTIDELMERANAQNRCRDSSKPVGACARGNSTRTQYRTNRELELDRLKHYGGVARHDGRPKQRLAGRATVWRKPGKCLGRIFAYSLRRTTLHAGHLSRRIARISARPRARLYW